MLTRLLKYAILAPSPHNSQPWLFRRTEHGIDLLANRSRSGSDLDPCDRQLHIGCGAALLNLRVAVRRFGNRDEVQLLPSRRNPEHLARVRPGGPFVPAPSDRLLFDAMPLHRTGRRSLEIRAVSDRTFEALADAAAREGAWLVRLHPHDELCAAEMIARADRQQFSDPEFRRALSRWLIRAGSRRRHGLHWSDRHGEADTVAPTLLRTFDRGDTEAGRASDVAVGSPLIAVLGTDGDGPLDWLRAGQALQRVLLTARIHGISGSFLDHEVDLEPMRDVAGREGFPQLVLRMGYGPDVSAVPRRAVADVLLKPDDDPASHDDLAA